MKGRRTRIHSDGLPAAHIVGELPFELFNLRSGADPSRPQRLHHLCDFFFPDERLSKRDEAIGGGLLWEVGGRF